MEAAKTKNWAVEPQEKHHRFRSVLFSVKNYCSHKPDAGAVGVLNYFLWNNVTELTNNFMVKGKSNKDSYLCS
jgi:hypothetical protein